MKVIAASVQPVGASFFLQQIPPTPAAQALKAKVVEIRPFPDPNGGMLAEVVCKPDNADNLLIVQATESDAGLFCVEVRMTQAEYNTALAEAVAGEDEESPEPAAPAPAAPDPALEP